MKRTHKQVYFRFYCVSIIFFLIFYRSNSTNTSSYRIDFNRSNWYMRGLHGREKSVGISTLRSFSHMCPMRLFIQFMSSMSSKKRCSCYSLYIRCHSCAFSCEFISDIEQSSTGTNSIPDRYFSYAGIASAFTYRQSKIVLVKFSYKKQKTVNQFRC